MQCTPRHRRVFLAGALALTTLAIGCGGGGGSSAPAPITLTALSGSTVRLDVPSTVLLGQPASEAFTLTGTNFGPVGGTAAVTFGDPDGPGVDFDGSSSATVPGVIVSSTLVEGNLPVITSPRLHDDVPADVTVTVPDGRSATLADIVRFMPPPTILSVRNLRAPFDAANPNMEKQQAFLAAVPTEAYLDGRRFDLSATCEIFATAGGPGAPIGSGVLGSVNASDAHMSGTCPVDPGLTANTPTTVRVTNPDQQFHDAAITYSVRDVLPNVNVTQQPGINADNLIAVNPTNPANAVVVAHADPANTTAFDELVVAYTTDHGETWSQVVIDETVDGFGAGDLRYYAVLEFDRFGNLYILYGVVGGGNTTVVLLQSADGGATFGNLRIQAQGTGFAYDEFNLATGLEPVTGGEAVYAAFVSFAVVPSPIVVNGCISTGLGNLGPPFAPPAAPVVVTDGVAPSLQWQLAYPEVGPAGELYVSFADIPAGAGPAPMNIYFDRDLDGLWNGTNGFGTDRLIASTNVGWKTFIPPQPERGIGAHPQLVCVRAGPHTGRLLLCYTEESPDDQTAQFSGNPTPNSNTLVVARISDDQGATWGPTIPVHTDTPEHQFLHWLGCDPVTGELYVTWYDCREDPANVLTQRMSASSPDGVTWTPALLLSQGQSSAVGNLGQDYLNSCGTAAHDGCVWACWSDFSDFLGDNPDGTTRCDVYVSVYMQR